MLKIEIDKFWPLGRKDRQQTPPLSDGGNPEFALTGQFTADQWRKFVDGMARLHQAVGYDDGTVFAEVPDGDKAIYFQTTRHQAIIKVRGSLGAEIITWGRTHAGQALATPVLTVIRSAGLKFDVTDLTFRPENPNPTKSEQLGKLIVENYGMSPERARYHCRILWQDHLKQ